MLMEYTARHQSEGSTKFLGLLAKRCSQEKVFDLQKCPTVKGVGRKFSRGGQRKKRPKISKKYRKI